MADTAVLRIAFRKEVRVQISLVAPFYMNLELIIKLVKLANNNPNENEANLAARKVCKMIAEGDYKFNNNSNLKSSILGYQPTKKQQEYYWYEEAENNFNWKETKFDSSGPNWYDDPLPKPKQYDKLNKKDLRCIKCGDIVNTGFVGPPQVFVCTNCQWK